MQPIIPNRSAQSSGYSVVEASHTLFNRNGVNFQNGVNHYPVQMQSAVPAAQLGEQNKLVVPNSLASPDIVIASHPDLKRKISDDPKPGKMHIKFDPVDKFSETSLKACQYNHRLELRVCRDRNLHYILHHLLAKWNKISNLTSRLSIFTLPPSGNSVKLVSFGCVVPDFDQVILGELGKGRRMLQLTYLVSQTDRPVTETFADDEDEGYAVHTLRVGLLEVIKQQKLNKHAPAMTTRRETPASASSQTQQEQQEPVIKRARLDEEEQADWIRRLYPPSSNLFPSTSLISGSFMFPSSPVRRHDDNNNDDGTNGGSKCGNSSQPSSIVAESLLMLSSSNLGETDGVVMCETNASLFEQVVARSSPIEGNSGKVVRMMTGGTTKKKQKKRIQPLLVQGLV